MVAGGLCMSVGYFFADLVLFGMGMAVANLPFNFVQAGANLVLGFVLAGALDKAKGVHNLFDMNKKD